MVIVLPKMVLGGLLIIFSDSYLGTGSLTSNGCAGAKASKVGYDNNNDQGGAGGGSISLFVSSDNFTNPTTSVNGGAGAVGLKYDNGKYSSGGNGGSGSVRKGKISMGVFETL